MYLKLSLQRPYNKVEFLMKNTVIENCVDPEIVTIKAMYKNQEQTNTAAC